jgi:dTDP-glucose pyrophosphorylase/predicted transcriptional regulator
MRSAADLCVLPGATIRQAIEIIDAQGVQIALVVDEAGHLLGTVTDGDVRRAMLAGRSLDGAVESVMYSSPSWVPVGTSETEVLEVMKARRVHQLPVLGEGREVLGVEVLDDLLLSSQLGKQVKARAASFRDEILPTPGEEHWVLLLAGGRGRRLAPLTEDLPKPMLPVGQKPILESIIRSLAAGGFRRFYLAVNYRAEVIEEYFGDGESFGVHIEYLREDRPLGTAGALSLLPARPTAPLLVMNGDLLTAIDPRQLLGFHSKEGAAATMCVREYDIQVPFGVVSLEQQRLVSIDEKPIHRFFVNAGIYLLEPECLDLLQPGEPMNMTTLFEQLVAGGAEAAVFPVREYWLDIGRMADLEKARGDAAQVLGD